MDDVLTYRMADDHFMLVVNASNIVKDFHWIAEHVKEVGGDAVAVNTSSRYALMALQGPAAKDVLQTLTGVDLSAIKYYWFATGEVAGVRVTISRTGYTGEDGFEVFVPPSAAERVWDAILQAGKSAGVVPAGLGARDTLRLEAAMRLYGNDMDDTTTVVEADLNWIVGWKKDDVPRLRRPEAPEGRRARRASWSASRCWSAPSAATATTSTSTAQKAGVVTSGTQTPYLKKAIGMAYVPADRTAPGTEFEIDIRGRRVKAADRSDAFLQESQNELSDADLKYTKDHEWVKIDGDTAKVGITDYAQKQLGDVVYLELPQVGRTLKKGEVFGTIESVKAVSELYSPVDGEVTEVHSALVQNPETVNKDPHGVLDDRDEGRPAARTSLLDAGAYTDLTK